jgi:hypothetical protein
MSGWNKDSCDSKFFNKYIEEFSGNQRYPYVFSLTSNKIYDYKVSMKKELVTAGFVLFSLTVPLKASAADFSQFVVFGDSLSDTGNLFNVTQGLPTGPVPPPPYFQGRFSNDRISYQVPAVSSTRSNKQKSWYKPLFLNMEVQKMYFEIRSTRNTASLYKAPQFIDGD